MVVKLTNEEKAANKAAKAEAKAGKVAVAAGPVDTNPVRVGIDGDTNPVRVNVGNSNNVGIAKQKKLDEAGPAAVNGPQTHR